MSKSKSLMINECQTKEKSAKNNLAGVIDIGSNAIRLLIGDFDENGVLRKQVKVREPIRLGHDAFHEKRISNGNIESTVQAFNAFKEHFAKYRVKNIRAVATSAVRESANQKEFIKCIEKRTGISVEVIDFAEEARLVYEAVHSEINPRGVFLLMDIGGGSVEFILGKEQKIIDSTSYPIGTVRLLQKIKDQTEPETIRNDLKNLLYPYLHKIEKFCHRKTGTVQTFVGTGGNLDCIGQLRKTTFRKVSSDKIRYHELDFLVEELFTLSPKRRIAKYDFRPDRNDVILPACLITQMLVKLLDVNKVYLPGVGLKEGLLLDLLKKTIH